AGMIRPLDRAQTVEELGESLLICEAAEMIDKLKPYQELGIDRVILNVNFGATQADTLDGMRRFADEVMPHFE
ncbi:MAG: LLM class flavin-dependent oxidoreductase, partial [Pikeienuella sp.]